MFPDIMIAYFPSIPRSAIAFKMAPLLPTSSYPRTLHVVDNPAVINNLSFCRRYKNSETVPSVWVRCDCGIDLVGEQLELERVEPDEEIPCCVCSKRKPMDAIYRCNVEDCGTYVCQDYTEMYTLMVHDASGQIYYDDLLTDDI